MTRNVWMRGDRRRYGIGIKWRRATQRLRIVRAIATECSVVRIRSAKSRVVGVVRENLCGPAVAGDSARRESAEL